MMISLDMIRGDVMKFDEIAIRQKFETKSFKMNKKVLIAFPSQYDHQYMHKLFYIE